MIFLKQSTSVTLLIGPFLDDTDGKTAETALTISQADVRLSKNGGNMAQKSETSSLTHDEIGYYTCALNTTDTNTLGILKVMVHEAGALPVWVDCMVLPANVYDSLVSGSDDLEVDAVAVEGQALSSFAGDNFNTFFNNSSSSTTKVVDDVGGGTGSDWTTTEKNQIRDRLGLDGTHATPSETPSLAVLLQTGAVTAAAVATGAIDADALAADAIDEIFDEVYEGTETFRQFLRVARSVLGGKSNGGGTTTINFRNIADTLNRVTATVDSNGNRTAVSVNLT